MNKIIGLFVGVVFLFPSVSFAAMPNFVGTGYKLAPHCTVPPDHGIWEIENGIMELTGCITADAWKQAQDAAHQLQITGVKLEVGKTITLNTGETFTCPYFFNKNFGCVVPKELI